MDIDDLLRENAPEFDSKLTKIMHDTAGKKVLKDLNETFETPDIARDWYFSQILSLDGRRPYDFCIEGNPQRVIDTLWKIKYSDY